MRLIVANWKMSLNKVTTGNLLLGLADCANSENEIVVCPSPAYLSMASESLRGSSIILGAQNCCQADQGAFTGGTSVVSLREFGCRYCIVGHSERRTLFGETNEMVSQKAALCITNRIIPIICIGETGPENASGQTQDVLTKQIMESIPTTADPSNVVIAYEPIWAIGTGQSATIEDLSSVFQFLTITLPGFRLLYGGSVTPENAQTIVDISGVNGLLIGGAALDWAKFSEICKIK